MITIMLRHITSECRRWRDETRAVAAIESAILFPVMITLLMGVFDIGNGIAVNQKAITSSQVMGDLLARYQVVDMNTIDDIIIAGRMAIEPYPTATWGYDIVSVEFDDDEAPEVLWQRTANMTANEAALDSTEIIAEAGDGVVIVSVAYTYRPFFSNFIVNDISMQEVAFLRGRRSTTVLCTDCPEVGD